jgi:DNA-binding IclR family transcriptional regulator
VFGRSGTADWALTLTGVESRFRADRRAELGAMLLPEAHQLTQRIRAQS